VREGGCQWDGPSRCATTAGQRTRPDGLTAASGCCGPGAALGTSGTGDVSVRGVCAEAGLGPRYFYEQFPDRDALLLAVADQVRDELLSVLVSSALEESGAWAPSCAPA